MKVLRLLLFPFSLIMIGITELRNLFFRTGILKQKEFDLPVIVVGNLSTGGTGKSPMIDYLLKLLNPANIPFNIASLSRGYGRKSTGFHIVLASGKAQQSGDEPLMLKILNPQADVYVDENRVMGIQMIQACQPQTKVILLDDAYQHRYVKPGLAILLTTWDNPFFNDFVLPMGSLREMRKNASQAQIIVVTKCPELTLQQMDTCINRIKKYSQAKVFFSGLSYTNPVSLFGSAPFPADTSDVLLVTGIANGDSINNHCKSSFQSVNHIEFGDHHTYNTADFTKITNNFDSFASQKKVVLTTHKDAVKWLGADAENLEILKKLPVYYQPIQMRILNNPDEFNELILTYVRATQPNS